MRHVRQPFTGTVACLTLLLSAGCHRSEGPIPKVERPAVTLDEVLAWLPEDTETIAVTGATVVLHAPSVPSRPETKDELRGLALGPLGIRDGKLYAPLEGARVHLAVTGARKFRAPTSLGSMRYEGCSVLEVDPQDRSRWGRLRAVARRECTTRVRLKGLDVCVIEEKLESDFWKFYIAFPEDGLLLIATDEPYLREMIERRRDGSPRAALPDDLPEWRLVDRSWDSWGLRHYAARKNFEDPSSPLHPGNMIVYDPQAIGLGFGYDADRDVALLRCLSSNRYASGLLEDYLERAISSEDAPLAFERLAPGILEVSVPGGKKSLFGFVLMLFLGFGVFV